MKVFISHKQEDSSLANDLVRELIREGVTYYLDLLDSTVTGSGKELTDHIKKKLNDCTDIIVVMSENTRYSQWVPFEVGMSAQIDMPTATYLHEAISLPSFLSYWPRLKKPGDISKYVAVRKEVQIEYRRSVGLYESSHYRESETEKFYAVLKSRL